MNGVIAPDIIGLFSSETLWLVVKLAFLLAFGIYILFAIVVLVQIRQMIDTLNGQLDNFLKSIGLLHLLIAIGSFLLALVIL